MEHVTGQERVARVVQALRHLGVDGPAHGADVLDLAGTDITNLERQQVLSELRHGDPGE